MGSEAYTMLTLYIRGKDEGAGGYPVAAEVNQEQGIFSGGLFQPDFAALRALEGQPEQYGLELFYALVDGPMRRAYDTASGYAEAQTSGRLRLRLWIDHEAAELHALAWERMHFVAQGDATPLSITGARPLSRYIGLETAAPAPIRDYPTRMLFAIANPDDLDAYRLAPIDVAQEVASVYDAIGPLQKAGQIELWLMPGRTKLPANLRRQLTEAGVHIVHGNTTLKRLTQTLSFSDYHILHFLGHGRFSKRRKTAALVLEDDAGHVQVVEDEELIAKLPTESLPHLVFTASCESARRDPGNNNPFVGLAPKLVRAGVPSVIAMQDYIPITAARTLSQDFYRHLLEHGSIDRALAQARRALYDAQDTTWAIPTLFMRTPTGYLFTPDPIRTALRAMIHADIFNPLPPGEAYLPLEVLHFSDQLTSLDLANLAEERAPSQDMMSTVADIFAASSSLSSLSSSSDVGQNGIPTSAGSSNRPTPEGEDSDRPRHPHETKFVGLIGGPGMGKSFQLRRFGHLTAQRSLTNSGPPILPVYIDLNTLDHEPWLGVSTIIKLILEALSPFWEEGSALRPAQLLTRKDGIRAEDGVRTASGVRLRILVDGSASLLANLRYRAWQALSEFAQSNPQHEYIISLNAECFDLWRSRLTNVLIIQPLTHRKIKAYLTRDPQNAIGNTLYAALKRAQLFDLAAMPWLLMRMLSQARRGEFPQSHVQVLRHLGDDAIADIAIDRGMRTRAAQTLHALAWRMQSTHRERLPIDEAFEIMAEVRGNRGYNLETLYQELITHELLDDSDDEGMSFTRSNIRAYYCAHALLNHLERDRLLSEITAMLGRQSLYEWWREPLVWLSGLMDDPSPLIERILLGVALSEGEYVFLAAQCIQESRLNNPRKPVSKTLRNYIINTLILRLDSQLELNVFRRVRAVETIGHLRAEVAIPHLVRLITDKVRQSGGSRPKFEYSSVRLAGLLALREVVDPPFDAVRSLSPWLVELLIAWEERDLTTLKVHLLQEDEAGQEISAGQQALAAFILGHIQTPRAIDLLISTFLTPGRDQMTYRNISTALTLLDPGLVTERAILPLIDPELAKERIAAGELSAELWEHRKNWYGNLIYMIGKIRTQNERARAFVLVTLESQTDVGLIALAIQSLGWLYDTNSKERFEAIALGEFDSLNLPPMATETAYQREQKEEMERYVQRKALEALYYIGDIRTLARLQHRPADWPPELESTFYRTSEAILMRQTSPREG